MINPNIHCNTKQVYDYFDTLHCSYFTDKQKNIVLKDYLGENMLLPASLGSYDALKQAYLAIKSKTQQNLYMSGSGATFFLAFKSENEAKSNFEQLKAIFPNYFIALSQTYNK